MSRASREKVISRQREAANGTGGRPITHYSDFGIGRLVAAGTVSSFGTAWRKVANGNADALRLEDTPRLVIAGDDELRQLPSWEGDSDDTRERHIGNLLTRVTGKGGQPKETVGAPLLVVAEDPQALFSVDDAGNVVASLAILPDGHPMVDEVTAVRGALGFPMPIPGEVDAGMQVLFGSATDPEAANIVNRLAIQRIGQLMAAEIQFEHVGPVPVLVR